MLYAFVANYPPGTTEAQRDGALARRAQWKWPQGTKPVAEFWSFGNAPLVYSVFEANDVAAVWRVAADWNDVFDVSIVPVMTAEEGLRLGPEVFAARTR
jgi:hypothetical protein